MDERLESNEIYQEIPKKRGRALTCDVKNNKEYFNEYYHEHNFDMICSCGQNIKSRGLYSHKKTKKHIYLMSKLAAQEEG